MQINDSVVTLDANGKVRHGILTDIKETKGRPKYIVEDSSGKVSTIPDDWRIMPESEFDVFKNLADKLSSPDIEDEKLEKAAALFTKCAEKAKEQLLDSFPSQDSDTFVVVAVAVAFFRSVSGVDMLDGLKVALSWYTQEQDRIKIEAGKSRPSFIQDQPPGPLLDAEMAKLRKRAEGDPDDTK